MTQYPILKTSFNHKSFCLTSVATENKTSTTKICLCVKFQVLKTLDEKTERTEHCKCSSPWGGD